MQIDKPKARTIKTFYTYSLLAPCVFMPAYALDNNEGLFALSLEALLDIKVNTRRIDESAIEVPRSLSVYTQEYLIDNNIFSIYDLSAQVANVSMRRSFGRILERPVVRGVTTIVGEKTAGTLINGLTVTDAFSSVGMHDIEQIEVLRGPEAALYGRSTFAGAINLVTKKPSTDHFFIDFKQSIATDSFSDTYSRLNVPINQSMAIATSVNRYKKGGYKTNSLGTDGGELGSEQADSASIALALNKNKVSIHYRADVQYVNDGNVATYLQSSKHNNCLLETRSGYYCGTLNTPSQVGFNNNRLFDFGVNKNVSRHQLETKYTEDSYDIKALVSHTDMSNVITFDGDFYELNSLFTTQIYNSQERSAEVYTNIYQDDLRSMIGLAYYSYEKQNNTTHASLNQGTLTQNIGDIEANEVHNFALFSSLDWSVSDNTDLILDLRYAHDTIKYSEQTQSTSQLESQHWTSFTPRVSLNHQLNKHELVFITYGKGIKPGGFNANIRTSSFKNSQEQQRLDSYFRFNEEQLNSLEMGYKGNIWANTNFLSASLFYYQWNDLQFNQTLPYVNSQNRPVRLIAITNLGKSINYGGEIELESTLSTHFKLRSSIGYVKAELKNTATSAQEVLTGDASVHGKAFPNVPNITLFTGLYYKNSLGEQGKINANITVEHESKRYVAEHNLAEIDNITKLNASIKYSQSDWSVALWAKNINNDLTPESAARFGDAATFFVKRAFATSFAEERKIGITFSYLYK